MRYHCRDQTEKLGPPPWDPLDPKLADWERHHGHDVRLSCEPEGCMLVEPDAFARGKRAALVATNLFLDEMKPELQLSGEDRRQLQTMVEHAEDVTW